MTKPVVFLDFDGMKFETITAHTKFINERYGIQTTALEHEHTQHRLDLLIKKHRSDITLSKDEIYTETGVHFLASIPRHEEVVPMEEEMPDVVKRLAAKYTLITVTARQTVGLDVIRYLIDKYIPGCISLIHCVYENRTDGGFNHFPKNEFIKNFVGEKVAFFDDSPTEILEMQTTLTSYLYDPFGKYTDRTEIKNHIKSWKEIGALLL